MTPEIQPCLNALIVRAKMMNVLRVRGGTPQQEGSGDIV
jgi:hypothetical protein